MTRAKLQKKRFPQFQQFRLARDLLSDPNWKVFLQDADIESVDHFHDFLHRLGEPEGIWKMVLQGASARTLTRIIDKLSEEECLHLKEQFESSPGFRSEIDFTGISQLKPSTVNLILDAIPGLRSVRLNSIKNLGKDIIRSVVQHTKVDEISLAHTQDMEAGALESLRGQEHLRSINLAYCDWVTDAHLEILSSCNHIKALRLAGCSQITDQGLDYIKKLPLEDLNLAFCQGLTEESWSRIIELKGLQELNVSRSSGLGTSKMSRISALQELRKLDLSQLQVEEGEADILNALSDLPKLENLSLAYWKNWTPEMAKHLKNAQALRRLHLERASGFDDTCLKSVASLQQLEELDLAYTAVEGKGFEAQDLASLRVLILDGTRVNDEALEFLGNLEHLSRLRLRDCPRIQGEGIQFLSGNTGLQDLNLSGCAQLKPEALTYLPFFEQLESLFLSACILQTGQYLEFVAALPNLRLLDLTFCEDLDGRYLPRLYDEGNGSMELNVLLLTGCPKIQPSDFLELAKLPSLQYLELGPVPEIGEESFEVFEAQAPECNLQVWRIGEEEG